MGISKVIRELHLVFQNWRLLNVNRVWRHWGKYLSPLNSVLTLGWVCSRLLLDLEVDWVGGLGGNGVCMERG
jgi:hypothetical protein